MRVRTHRTRLAGRLIVVAALAASTMVMATGSAHAHHCTGSGNIDDHGGDVVAECHGVTPGRPPTRASVEYLWELYCSGVAVYEDGFRVEFVRAESLTAEEVELFGFDPTGVYWWYTVLCWGDGDGVEVGDIAVEVTAPVPPEVLRDRARARIEPPVPAPATSPPLDAMTFVNFSTWLWVDESSWVPVTESESQGFTTVTVTATPVVAVWDMGEGDPVSCVGPGVAWVLGSPEDGTDCSYTYVHSSYGRPGGRFEASVSVTWVFEWWINDRPQGVFGDLEVSTSFVVAVAEIQALETGD